MSLPKYLYNCWCRQCLLQRGCQSGLLLLFAYLPWHWLFINGIVPGPYPVAVFLHGFFFLGFWVLLLFICCASFIFPIASLKEVQRRWFKTLGFALLGVVGMAVSLPLSVIHGGLQGLIGLFFLIVAVDIWWIIVANHRFPHRVKVNGVVTFSLLIALTVGLMPFNGYGIDHVDDLHVNVWNKNYRMSYMSFDDYGKLSLYECGSAKLLCRKIYHYCNNLGPGGAGKLSWTDERLTLMLNNTELYQRFKTKDNAFHQEINPSWADWHSNGVCRYSVWGT